ncbi:bacterial transcriptional activator domain-containing protein [Actinosynnema sp. CA-248983]
MSTSDRVSWESAGYVLHADGMWVDVVEFQRALEDGVRLDRAGDADAAVRRYEQAVALYDGPYLPESSAMWAVLRRERYKDMQMHALSRLADESSARRDLQRTVDLHHRILELDPCREASYRELMRAHAELRQPSRVHDWYRTCVAQLGKYLGVGPSVGTEHVFRQCFRLAGG